MSDRPEKDMEALSKAIVEAIIGSSDVKEALEKLQKIDAHAANSIMVFMVRLDSLSGAGEKGKRMDPVIEEALELKPKKRKSRKTSPRPPIVDGKIISKNEQKFLDYLAQKKQAKTGLAFPHLEISRVGSTIQPVLLL